MKVKVSAVIITYNEATNLVRSLSQLYWCDEIIIVDNYSTDDTVAVCRHYGCKIYYRSYNESANLKCFGISKAVNDWILCIDPDEYLTPRVVAELEKELEDTKDYTGYIIRGNLVFRGKEFKYGKESNRYCLKLFSRKWSIISKENGQDTIEVIGQIKKLRTTVVYYRYRNVRHFISGLDCNTYYYKRRPIPKWKIRMHVLIFVSVPVCFFKIYFIDRNFLNGINGFNWSVLCAFRWFIEYVKVQDIREMRSDDSDFNINIILSKTADQNSIFLRPVVAENLN